MSKLVCYFSGWFESDLDTIELTDPESQKTQTAQDWINEKGNIDNLILADFNEANGNAVEGEFEDLYLKVEE